MINLLIYVLALCLGFGLLYYIVSLFPLPDPFGKIARLVILVIFLLILLSLVLNVLGMGSLPSFHIR